MTVLNVLYQSSAAFVTPTAISMYSLCRNNAHLPEIHFHLISDGIEGEDLRRLEGLVSQFGRKLTVIDGAKIIEMVSEAGVEPYHGSVTCFMKLFAADAIKVDSILYLDSDTIITGDLRPLTSFDLSCCPCAIAYEIDADSYRQHFGTHRRYFNTGVILFNLVYWREREIGLLLRRSLKQYAGKLLVGDRDLLERTIGEDICPLPARFNVTTLMHFFGSEQFLRKHGYRDSEAAYYPEDELNEARQCPAVVHYLDVYTGMPWERLNTNPFTPLYCDYARQLKPWRPMRPLIRRGWLGCLKKAVVSLQYALPKNVRVLLILTVLNVGTRYQIWRHGLRGAGAN